MLLYCLKCKSKQECTNINNIQTKNGRMMAKGICKKCNSKCSQFIGGNKTNNNKVKKTKKNKNFESELKEINNITVD